MTSIFTPFSPTRGATVTLSPSATSVDADFAPNSNNGGGLGNAVLVTNAGTVIAFARLQTQAGAAAATAADTPILPGQARILNVGYRSEPWRVSVFASAATTVYVTPGEGGI